MPGRKLLYLLRTATAAQGDALLPGSTSSSQADDISVVILDAPPEGTAVVPGKTFLLQDEGGATPTPSGISILSYGDLLNMIFEVDSTIVLSGL